MRVILFILIVLGSINVGWFAALLLAALYVYLYGGIELLCVAALFDAFYGVGFGIPAYLGAATMLTVGMELARPYLKSPEEFSI